jgi:hypothetical protein
MDKILALFNALNDKLKHIIAGALIVCVVSQIYNTVIAMIACVAIGAGKELIWDKLLGLGDPDPADFAATIAGGMFGLGIAEAILQVL